jgi:uncharacterized membrane protein YfcA
MSDLVILASPATLLATLIAVTLTGLSKGGLGGAFALMAVPILALVMPPVQAAALMLPILLIMDAVGLYTWRGWRDLRTLAYLLPPALVGIALGAATAAYTSDAMVRLMLGGVALIFVARMALSRVAQTPRAHSRPLAAICGTAAGFTSFVAHAGGPPFQIYTLPLRLDPKIYTGTSVIFFALVNLIKVIPYAALGQFTTATLLSALVMLPLAVASTLAGAALVRRMRIEVFYPFMLAMIALVALRLIWDGARGLS